MPESMPLYDPRIVPPPPRLHWGIVLALQIVTLGLFQLIWFVVQAWWVKRMTGENKGFVWAMVNLCAFPAVLLLAFTIGVVVAMKGQSAVALSHALEPFARIVFIVLNITTAFTLRSQMESHPINMPLSGVMTFFFGTIYFQYHMNNYVLPDPNEVFGDIPAAPVYVPPTLSEAEQP